MEGVKDVTVNNKNKKKQNMVLRFNGGSGIGGIVVLGGAIAFAALVTFVANKRNKSKPTTRKDTSHVHSDLYRESNSYRGDDQIGSEGLQLLAQPESEPIVHLNRCKSDDKAEIGFEELSQNVIKEEICLSETDGVEEEVEMQQNDDRANFSKSELTNPVDIIPLCIDKEEENENQKLQVTETYSTPEEEMDTEAEAMLLELVEEENQEGEIPDTSSTEENPSTEAEKKDYSDNNGEDEQESEGSSEETRDSSIESNADPIWPTEKLENPSMKWKENNFSHHESVADKIGNKDVTDKNDIGDKYDDLIAAKYGVKFQLVKENGNSQVGNALMTTVLLMVMIILLLTVGLIKYYPHLFHGDSAI